LKTHEVEAEPAFDTFRFGAHSKMWAIISMGKAWKLVV
jgi:hypothetical protein